MEQIYEINLDILLSSWPETSSRNRKRKKQVIEGFNETASPEGQMSRDYQDEATREPAHSIRIAQQDSLRVDKVTSARQVIIVPSITVEIKEARYFKQKFVHSIFMPKPFQLHQLSRKLENIMGS